MNFLRKLGLPVAMFVLSTLAISTTQWALQRGLSAWCHPAGLWGALTNMIHLGSPFCLAMNTVQLSLANHYVSVWNGAATFCATWFVQRVAFPFDYEFDDDKKEDAGKEEEEEDNNDEDNHHNNTPDDDEDDE